MSQEIKSLNEIIEIFNRRKFMVIIPAAIILCVSIIVAYALPKIYSATSVILIESQEIPKEYVSANVTTFADQRLQTINQRITSATNLIDIIKRFKLYLEMSSDKSIDEIIEKMRKDINFKTIGADVVDPRTGRPAQATIAFSVSYQGKNPNTVQAVANELASLYLEENLKVRSKQSEETYKFLDEEMKRVQAELSGLEKKIAEYKENNIDSLPELMQANVQGMEMAERDIAAINNSLSSLYERESNLQLQLAGMRSESKNRTIETLKDLRMKLADLKSKYSDEHPDVRNTLEEIKVLEANAPSNGSFIDDRSNNPAYIALSSQVAGIRSEIGSAKKRLGELNVKREDYQARMEASPKVEEGYKGLIVQRNNSQQKYDELNKKAMDAKVAHSLEKEQLGERFSVIDAARLPEKPSSPKKPLIMLIGLIAGIGIGVLFAAVSEGMDNSVRSPEAVQAATGFQVLTIIPSILTEDDIYRKMRLKRIIMLGIVVFACVFFVILFVLAN